MTTATLPPADTVAKAHTGQRVELARYTIAAGERIVYGQRVDGAVRLTDKPAHGEGRSYLIERGLHRNAELEAILADYLHQATRHHRIPARVCWL